MKLLVIAKSISTISLLPILLAVPELPSITPSNRTLPHTFFNPSITNLFYITIPQKMNLTKTRKTQLEQQTNKNVHH